MNTKTALNTLKRATVVEHPDYLRSLRETIEKNQYLFNLLCQMEGAGISADNLASVLIYAQEGSPAIIVTIPPKGETKTFKQNANLSNLIEL